MSSDTYFALCSLELVIFLNGRYIFHVPVQPSVWQSTKEVNSQKNKLLHTAQLQPFDKPCPNSLHDCDGCREPVSCSHQSHKYKLKFNQT